MKVILILLCIIITCHYIMYIFKNKISLQSIIIDTFFVLVFEYITNTPDKLIGVFLVVPLYCCSVKVCYDNKKDSIYLLQFLNVCCISVIYSNNYQVGCLHFSDGNRFFRILYRQFVLWPV